MLHRDAQRMFVFILVMSYHQEVISHLSPVIIELTNDFIKKRFFDILQLSNF